MQFLYHLSVTKKFALLTIITAFVVATLTALLFTTNELIFFRQNRSNELVVISDLISLHSVSAITGNSPVHAELALSALHNTPHILSAAIFSEEGKLLARYSRNNTTFCCPDSHLLSASATIYPQTLTRFSLCKDTCDFFKAIAAEGKIIGSVYIRAEMMGRDHFLRMFPVMFCLIFIPVCGAAFLTASKNQKKAASPPPSPIRIIPCCEAETACPSCRILSAKDKPVNRKSGGQMPKTGERQEVVTSDGECGESVFRILLVEDTRLDAQIFRFAFEKNKIRCEITHCTSAGEALEKLLEVSLPPFDVIVTDYHLPGMSGLELCKEIIHSEISLPVVILTGEGSENVAVEALRIGAYDYIIKDLKSGYLNLLPFVIADVIRSHRNDLVRKRAQEENRAILATVPNGVVVIDKEKVIRRFNPAAEKLFGYAADEVIGCCADLLIPEISDADYGRCYQNYRPGSISEETNTGREVRGRRKNGTDFPLALAISEMHIGSEQMWVGVMTNITHRKQTEASLIAAKEDAEAASLAKSRFLANMSHEIRTPMNAVMGMAELLLTTGLTERQYRLTDTIRRSGKTLLAIINDILDFSKIEAGKLELIRTEFNLHELVEETADLFADQARSKGLELACRIWPEVAPRFHGDPNRLRQILINLMGNAVKFTRQGEVVVSVRAPESAGDMTTLRFDVRDTGIGISSELQQAIFDPFSQADDSVTRSYGGTGLGLAIVGQLTEMMGGAVGLESEAGKGSRFWFTVRLKSVMPPDIAETFPALSDHLSVLVVNSNATLREILCQYLDNWGICCQATGEATAADRMLRQAVYHSAPFRIVILDMENAASDAVNMAMKIRSDPLLSDTGLILLTADKSRLPEGRTSFCYLEKPIRQSRLYNCIIRLTKAGDQMAVPDFSLLHGPEGRSYPYRILLVEDHIVNQDVGVGMLEFLGCTVDVAANGREGVSAFMRASYDLIFMDCQMPEMDGYTATSEIRKHEGLSDPAAPFPAGTDKENAPHVPIIALTAHAMEGDRKKCLAAGMDDHLSKPFNLGQLRAMMDRWLSPHPSRKAKEPDRNADDGKNVKESPLPVDPSILNNVRALQREGKPDLLTRLISHYLNHAPKLLQELRADIKTDNTGSVREIAHTLKSNSGNVGALSLAKMCREMEDAGRTGDIAKARHLLISIENEYTSVKAFLKKELSKRDDEMSEL